MPDARNAIPPTTKLSALDTLNHIVRLAKEYFLKSEHAYWALLVLLGIVCGVLSTIALTVIFTSHLSAFFQALTVMNLPLFIESMETLLVIFIGWSAIQYVTSILSGNLAASWREWLTHRISNQFTREQRYLRLNRENPEMDGIDLTIEKSIKDFVELTLSLGKDLLEKTLSLPVYLRTLWMVGGGLTIVVLGINFTIHGYLVLAALLFAIVGSAVSHLIGHTLKDWLNSNANAEANLRREVSFVNDNAESIGLAETIHHHQATFEDEMRNIRDNSYRIAQIQAGIDAFNTFYQPIAFLFPYVAMAPLYFARKISEGELNSAGYAFGQALSSFNWFINSYAFLSQYAVSIERIVELENAMRDQHQDINQMIMVQTGDINSLRIENLSIAKTNASSTDYIMHHLNLTIDPQKNTFIRGESGVGKSTLFKAIAGTWKNGEGNIFIPADHKLCFLPQTPLIPPHYTLAQLLDYNHSTETHTQHEYEAVLRATGMSELINDLHDTNKDWVRTLSGGQKQTIAFARILLKKEKPTLIFLDEATSAMDEERQALMYRLLKNLDGTKVVSIAHSSSAIKFHDEVIDLSLDEERKVTPHHTAVRNFCYR